MSEPESPEIFLVPPGLIFNHGLQGLESEGVSGVVERDSDASSIWMCVALVASDLAAQRETVLAQSADDLPGGDIAQLTVIKGHAARSLDGDSDAGFGRNLDFFAGSFRNRNAVFAEFIHDHPDHLVDVLESLLLGMSPSGGPILLECRAPSMPVHHH